MLCISRASKNIFFFYQTTEPVYFRLLVLNDVMLMIRPYYVAAKLEEAFGEGERKLRRVDGSPSGPGGVVSLGSERVEPESETMGALQARVRIDPCKFSSGCALLASTTLHVSFLHGPFLVSRSFSQSAGAAPWSTLDYSMH